MKKIKKFFFAMLLVYLTVFQVFGLKVSASSSDIDIPDSAQKYAESYYESAVSAVREYSENYNVKEGQLDAVKLARPFVVYEIGETTQDEIYYYPILDSTDNIVLLLSVMGTTDGWKISVSEEWVDGLNKIGTITPEYIFYKSEDNIYAENKQEKFCVEGETDLQLCSFSIKPYEIKRQEISDFVNRFVKTDVSSENNIDVKTKDGYTPSFSSSLSDSTVCALYNKKGQGSYNLCWAASVATICNYRDGTNISAKNVANRVGIDYNAGANITVAQDALKSYGVNYYNMHANKDIRMSWSSLKSNIRDKYPVYASAKSHNSGHAVTAYGYTVAAGVKYVIFWNSGNESSMAVEFKENGTSFSYAGKTYTWMYSVCKYY
ncbi:MAG: hypothetical protein HFH14_05615 [Lachnospiraceae bacterium]|nr:hypothetical protein [Lachnospiraceae bacterium]